MSVPGGIGVPGGVSVSDLTLDSREARPGSLFFALPGRNTHGLAHCADAVSRGAVAVLWEPDGRSAPPSLPAGVFAAPVRNLSSLVGSIADRFFGEPSAAMQVLAFTGTNGKTTCAYLLAQAFERLGTRAGYAGTIGWGRIGRLVAQSHTTADAISVHRRLAAMRSEGVGVVAMEVSSHALDQHRIDGVRLACAAFTNLSRDHLDYHGTMQAYAAAKSRLFEFPGLRRMVINVGDPFGRELAQRCAGQAALTAVWVGGADGADEPASRRLYALEVAAQSRGTRLAIEGSYGRATLRTKLIGRFNAENAILVLGCLLAVGEPMAGAVAALGDCEAPPGRMQLVAASGEERALAVIDYAHTPDALGKALTALREHCRGALWCVFGCGGDRDAGKRPLMGAIADALADHLIITDDNPRSEDPAAIVRAILEGVTSHVAQVIHDRARAIATALAAAGAGDVVLIAGKGHEDYQIYGTQRRLFSDLDEARRHLGEAA
ncbi:MAG: UDP-N-acetylmuramoyl-L-alanyl-D-glutamate--2,6-diaminopimelate ligase [Steroidobacteraceae bacterium]|nr:UDP-N-acetylmuramoyl-L-alanyl-D-glutamate--2,6-diaminopimelate ligase [Steroidobacteraceae bacterium]